VRDVGQFSCLSPWLENINKFSPSKGHEQKSYRPAFVISDPVTQKALNGLVTIVPITNSISTFFTRVNLDKYNIRTKGDILMDQIKVLDLSEREYEFIEKAPKDVLSSVILYLMPYMKNC
jgi:mRNA interferase MazF